MLRELDAAAGGQLIADPVTLVFIGVERQRAWERTWKLASHEGDQRRVSLVVEEANDHEVVVKVGSNVVDRLVPPWIAHRQRGETVTPEDDLREREQLNKHVLEAVERGLLRERELADTLSRAPGTPFLRVAEQMETNEA
jgi:hypothetical protein